MVGFYEVMKDIEAGPTESGSYTHTKRPCLTVFVRIHTNRIDYKYAELTFPTARPLTVGTAPY